MHLQDRRDVYRDVENWQYIFPHCTKIWILLNPSRSSQTTPGASLGGIISSQSYVSVQAWLPLYCKSLKSEFIPYSGWWSGSSDSVPSQQLWGLEFKLHYCKIYTYIIQIFRFVSLLANNLSGIKCSLGEICGMNKWMSEQVNVWMVEARNVQWRGLGENLEWSPSISRVHFWITSSWIQILLTSSKSPWHVPHPLKDV
jgi:hypothetical protein